jgi:outer membrane protein TolC
LSAIAEIPDVPDPAAGQPGDVLRNRPDVRAAEQQLIAANAGIGTALAEYYPKITLSGLLGQFTNHLASFGSGDSTVAQGAAGLHWRLFDFGRVDAEVRVARGRDREARAAYRQAVLLAAESVETSFAQLTAARERLERLTAERGSLAAAATAAARAFQAGEISRDDALTTSRAVARLDFDIAGARRDIVRATVACERAIGANTG